MDNKNLLLDVMVAGTLGDAYGYPVEFLQWDVIQKRYGPNGVRELLNNPDRPVATDDTQMTLFVMESIINAYKASNNPTVELFTEEARKSFLRWLETQSQQPIDGMFADAEELFVQRAPGNTCISSLLQRRGAESRGEELPDPINTSKGCGVVMRSAPYAFLSQYTSNEVWSIAQQSGAITHGHVEGPGSGAALAYMMHHQLSGLTFDSSIRLAIGKATEEHAINTAALLQTALALGQYPWHMTPDDMCDKLGEGWTGESALAIGVYATLRSQSVIEAIQLGTNHRGDSDSTAMIAGQLAVLKFSGVDSEVVELFNRVDLAKVVGTTVTELQKYL